MHRNLTPSTQNKLLRRVLSGTLLLAAASGLMAQDSDPSSYQGPGISSPGVGNIGRRGGEQLDLRYYVGVSGIADNAIAPFRRDAKGNLIRIPYLYGFEVDAGVYGVHNWKRSQLGLDYVGSYTKYVNIDGYNGDNHSLTLGYTGQVSRRFRVDLREAAGSLTYGSGQVANAASAEPNNSFTPAVRLFDLRTYFLQSSASVNWLQSARTSYSFGASTFLQNLKSLGLSNGWGYSVNGSMMRRLSKSATVGLTYQYSYFDFPGFSSLSRSHTLHGLYATGLRRFWTLSIEAGATVTQTEQQFTVTLNPILAALFGRPTLSGINNFRTTYPSGSVALVRKFQRATLGFNYFRGVNSGNGFYNTGRMDNASISFSYTGVRKLNLGGSAGYYSLKSIGQNLGNYAQYSAGAGLSYSLGHSVYLAARYDFRDQQINDFDYFHHGSRTTIGLNFSPGSLPLSLW